MEQTHLHSLINTALGKEHADLVIANGSLLNVYTGELQPKTAVAIKGERIAYVGPEVDSAVGPQTTVLDVEGKVLIPGFIDGHNHIDNMITVAEFLRYAIPTGTTTVITETSAFGNAHGYSGVLQFIENLKDQPILLYALTPSEVPTNPGFEGSALLLNEQIDELLKLPEVVGVGETFWARAVDADPIVLEVIDSALRSRKPIQGHSAGAKGKKLAAYAAAGVTSCHEPITAEEALERLRLGMHTMIREGSIRRDLPAIAPIKDAGIDLRRAILVSDVVSPEEMMELGYMDYIVQRAIDLGFDPVKAIQMATLNVAEHFGLDHLIGGIAPGRYANINVIPEIGNIRCDYVIGKGRIVAAEGRLLVQPRKDVYPKTTRSTVHLSRPFSAQDFCIPATGSGARARAISVVRDMLTGEEQVDVEVTAGAILATPQRDVLKVAVINRQDGCAEKFVGLIRGFGLRAGAFAATISWDCYNVIVVGADEDDMALAVNRIREMQGGVVLCQGGEVLEEIPLPIAGLVSDLPLEEVARRLRRMSDRLKELGSPLSNPFLTLQTLSFTPLPFLRITEKGLLDVRQKRLVSLFLS